MDAVEIVARVRELPELPTIYASNMLYAQAHVGDSSFRQAIEERQSLFRELGISTTVSVPVRDDHGSLIGHISFAGT